MKAAQIDQKLSTPPLLRLTPKQHEKLTNVLKGMTLAGSLALVVKDEDKFQSIYDNQQAIIQALGVLGIHMEAELL